MRISELDKMIIDRKINVKRNIKEYNFVTTLSKEKSIEIIERIKGIIERHDIFSGAKYVNLNTLDEYKVKELREKGILRSVDEREEIYSGLFIWDGFYMLVNYTEHIEIIGFDNMKGFEELYLKLVQIEDVLESELELAFDEKYGYLTTTPENIGTGLVGEITFHLPTMVMSGGMDKIYQAASQIGMDMAPLYERENTRNYRFKLKNIYTLGASEHEILDSLKSVSYQILSKELELRDKLLAEKRINIEDRVYRALGILKNCRIIGYTEAYENLDDLRYGIESGLIDFSLAKIDKIIDEIGNYTIFNNTDAKKLEEIDVKRASLIRKELEDYQ